MDCTDPMPTCQWGQMAIDPNTRVIANVENQRQKYVSKNELVLLQCLIEGPQAKETLIQRIWFDLGLVVTDASYYQLVAQLRNSLAEIGLPKSLIKTIPRYGLELAGPKEPVVVEEGREREGGEEREGEAEVVEASKAVEPPMENVPAPDIPLEMAAPQQRKRWWQRVGRKELVVSVICLTFSGLVAGSSSIFKGDTRTAVASGGWIQHRIAQANVKVDGPISNEYLEFYIGAIKREADLVGAGHFDNYYLRRKPDVVEILGCAKNKSVCVTYYFY